MDFAALSKRIADGFSHLSPQLQRAARHVLDRPDDVALMSMRRLAQSAGVHPSTMVRLARAFDFASYNDFREPFQQRLRVRPAGYLARARDLQARGAGEVPRLMQEMLAADIANLRETFEANSAERLLACADALTAARRVYVVGLRSCFPVAFFFHYAYRMFRGNATLLEGRGGTFADDLRTFGERDLMFAISIEPYTDETVRAVEYAKDRGGTAVVMTDSLVSPLAKRADHVVTVRTGTPSFFHSIAAAITTAEALVAVMVARGGKSALYAIEESERQLGRFDAYWHKESRKRRSRSTRRKVSQ